jgi:hypothetical protein
MAVSVKKNKEIIREIAPRIDDLIYRYATGQQNK